MPDHQIVIKLDKDRFDEAQKLAKEAGFRSATSYIRNRVIEFLDKLEQSSESSEVSPEVIERIKKVDNDLARMQQELQVFISETDSNLQSFDPSYADYRMESEQRFSDSIGATFDIESSTSQSTSGETTSTFIDFEKSAQSKTTDLPNPTDQAIEAPKNDDDTEKNVWRSSGSKYDAELDTEALEDLESFYKENKASTPSPEGKSDSATISSNDEKIKPTPKEVELKDALSAVDEANDELEELADRAFSISPRLGAVEDKQPAPIEEDDPLADLLDDNLVEALIAEQKTPLESQIIEHQTATEVKEEPQTTKNAAVEEKKEEPKEKKEDKTEAKVKEEAQSEPDKKTQEKPQEKPKTKSKKTKKDSSTEKSESKSSSEPPKKPPFVPPPKKKQ